MAPRFRFALACMLMMLAGSLAPRQAAAAPAAPVDVRYFKETGHNLIGDIRAFYEANGDVAAFGLPLTEVIAENGLQVQYFERARFELHPENGDTNFVTLTLVGRMLTQGRTDAAFQPVVGKTTDKNIFFKETGHNLGGGFLTTWQKRNGLVVFGYPLSEEFTEVSPIDGQTYTVQYFERARFEYHPEATPGNLVQFGLLGRQLLDKSSVPAAARKAVPELKLLSKSTTGYFGSIAERVNNIGRGVQRMSGQVVQPGGVFSFNTGLGPTGTEDGFVDGYAIVGGKLEKVIGGGLCQVSTTLYCAAFHAGLGIVERRPHSFSINFYENIVGFDATVYAPTTDFRFRNDMAGQVYIIGTTNVDKATATFSLYGFPDGRTTEMVGPKVKNEVKQGIANWQFDSSLAKGEIRHFVHGRPGFEVEMQRIIRDASGKVVRTDNLPSKYKPWEDFFLYGTGVTPPKGVNLVAGDANADAKKK